MWLHGHPGVEGRAGARRAQRLVRADGGLAVDDLAVEVAQVDRVSVHDAQAADAGGGEVEGGGGAEAARAHDEHRAAAEPRLGCRRAGGQEPWGKALKVRELEGWWESAGGVRRVGSRGAALLPPGAELRAACLTVHPEAAKDNLPAVASHLLLGQAVVGPIPRRMWCSSGRRKLI